MRMRPKSTHQDLPPRMVARERARKDGSLWVGYYYNGRDESGKRKEFALGTDLIEAKRKWAELEAKPVPPEAGIMRVVFDRYERSVIPSKAPRTGKDNLVELANLRKVFDSAPIDQIKPAHIAQYRDKRGETASTRANREIALFSHCFNMAREWGYTDQPNPCRGVRRNKEHKDTYYATDEVWQALHAAACQPLRDAMDLAYLTGQRTADVLKMSLFDLRDGALEVQQNKTGKKLRILLAIDGEQTELGALVDRVRVRPQRVANTTIVINERGQPLNRWTLRQRLEKAKQTAAAANPGIAAGIAGFQFKHTRSKTGSDIEIAHAQALLGHSKERITRDVYQRKGATVRPLR